MKKLIIKKQGLEVQHCRFDDEQAMQNFIKLLADQAPWGKPDRWLKDSPLAPLSEEEKAKATETRVVQNDLGEEVTEYFFPAEYTIEIEDITAQVELEAEQGEARRYLNETDWMIIRELEGGKKVPSKVKDSRAEARLKLSKDLEASEDKADKGLIKRVLEALGIG